MIVIIQLSDGERVGRRELVEITSSCPDVMEFAYVGASW
jgi:hypothetical protein